MQLPWSRLYVRYKQLNKTLKRWKCLIVKHHWPISDSSSRCSNFTVEQLKRTDRSQLVSSLVNALSEFRSKTHKRLQERFLMEENRTKRANFRASPLFSSYEQHKNRRKKPKLIQLILYQLDVGGWRKEKGTRLTFFFFLNKEFSSIQFSPSTDRVSHLTKDYKYQG